MIVAASILSIAFNPLMFAMVPHVRSFAVRHFSWARAAAMVTDPFSVLPKETSRRMLQGQTILVGTGEVARNVMQRLHKEDIPTVSVLEDKSEAEALRADRHAAITGDASDPMVLVQAHIVTAAVLMLLDPDPVKSMKIIDTARQLNPEVKILVRTRTVEEAERLAQEGFDNVLDDPSSISSRIARRISRIYMPPEEDEVLGEDEVGRAAAH